MPEIVREPIGLRVLIRAVRPEDQAPFLVWRADRQVEIDALLERGEDEQRAALWASLLRWSEAQAVASALVEGGWTMTFHGVRAIVLDRAITLLGPPQPEQGWQMEVAGIRLQAVAELPEQDEAALSRLLAFLDT